MPDSTIDYYNAHGQAFSATTVTVEMSSLHDRFLAHVPDGGMILDAGCGSGRDAKAFLERGYRVTAIDASSTMVDLARHLSGLPVRQLRFQEVDYVDAFDGIWACASLLHVPRADLDDVLSRLLTATRPGGVLYASFKLGDGERVSNGRHFTDFTSTTLREWLVRFPGVEMLDLWETADLRPHRTSEMWVNAIFCHGKGTT